MNRNVKIGLVVLAVILLMAGFWKMSAPNKNEPLKNIPPKPIPSNTQGSGTAPEVAADGTTTLDADLIASTGTQDTNDAVVASSEGLISDEPA